MTDTPTTHRSSGTKWLLIIGAILLVAVIVFAVRSFLLLPPSPPNTSDRPLDLPVEAIDVTSMDDVADIMEGKPLPSEIPELLLPPINQDDHVYGLPDAPLSIVEYSNYGNTYAALLHPALRSYVDTHGDEVNWIVRHYPITPADFLPAQAAECAYFEQGHAGFWSFFDASFALQQPTKSSLLQLATTLGFNSDSFTTCLENDFTRDKVLGDAQDGRLDARITVAPSYVLAHHRTSTLRLVEGINTIEYLDQVLDTLR